MGEILVGDARETLATLPAESIHCCVTSPPYWGLRDYGEPGQLGLEPTPEEYVQRLVGIFREVRRVLRGDGTLWLNLGDSYATSGVAGPQRDASGGLGGGRDLGTRGEHGSSITSAGINRAIPRGLKPKDLVGIPWRVAFALQADGWYLRSDIIWSKPNPMPESVTDRPTKAHEYLFLLSRSPRYFYDADAVREASDATGPTWEERKAAGEPVRHGLASAAACGAGGFAANPAGRNRRSVWTIATQPFPGAHFAVMPPALVRPCVLAGTSARGVCPECGAPWGRVVERTPMVVAPSGRAAKMGEYGRICTSGTMTQAPTTRTTGWAPTCAHTADPIPATVLDPFAGAGTVPLVAAENGRGYIGIELNPEYAEMARERIRLRGKTPVADEVEPGQESLFPLPDPVVSTRS